MENNTDFFSVAPADSFIPEIEEEEVQVQVNEEKDWRGNEYYKDTTSWSSSMLKMLEEDELDFDKWFKGEKPDACEDVFAKGQYLHDYMARMIDKNYKSECKFLFLETTDKRKKEYKDAVKDIDLNSVYVLSESEKFLIENLANDFLRSDYFQSTMAKAENPRVEIGYVRPYKDFSLKGKLDFEFKIGNKKHVFDWKTSSNFSDFNTKAWYYKYHRQAYIYDYIADAESFTFVVFDMVSFKRWKIVKVNKFGKFFEYGEKCLEQGIELAKQYLEHGVDAKCFKVCTI